MHDALWCLSHWRLSPDCLCGNTSILQNHPLLDAEVIWWNCCGLAAMRIATSVKSKLFAYLLVVLIENFPCKGTRFLDHRSCLEKHKVLETLRRARDHFALCGA